MKYSTCLPAVWEEGSIQGQWWLSLQPLALNPYNSVFPYMSLTTPKPLSFYYSLG